MLVLVLRPGLLLLLLLRLLILLHTSASSSASSSSRRRHRHRHVFDDGDRPPGRGLPGNRPGRGLPPSTPTPERGPPRPPSPYLVRVRVRVRVRVSAIAAAHGLNVSAPTTTGFHDARLVAQLDHPVCLGGGPSRGHPRPARRDMEVPEHGFRFSTSTGSSENSARDSGAHDRNLIFATKLILFAVLGHRPYTKESKIKKKPL